LWTRLERLEDIVPFTRGCNAPAGLWLFGSDRLGRGLAFDARSGKPRIIAVVLGTFEEECFLGSTLLQALRTLGSLGREAHREATREDRPDVPFVPTDEAVVRRMLSLARVTRNDLLYDLGCGDGRIPIAAARLCGARAVGFDIDPHRVREARENVARAGVERLVSIRRMNLFEVDLSPADVVTTYLLPSLKDRLVEQFRALRPGARIVSHAFAMHDHPPKQVVSHEFTTPSVSHLYLWEAPLVSPIVASKG